METREQFLLTATRLFAEKGFYGTSIASIAGELGLTKQALIHHFGTKEKLYGEVLQRISERLLGLIDQAQPASSGTPLETVLLQILTDAMRGPVETQLLMRELLDNRRRAARAEIWYLKPFLQRLMTMLQALPGWHDADEAQALTCLYPLLGAINYFAISTPTLERMYSKPCVRTVEADYAGQLSSLIRAAVARTPAPPVRRRRH